MKSFKKAALALLMAVALPPVVGAATIFDFRLEGDQAVPPVTTSNSGECLAVLDDGQSSLQIACVHTIDAAEVTAAHIHVAPAGSNGSIAYPVASGESPIDDTWVLSALDVNDLLSGDLYVNVHTNTVPGGELRGQIVGPRMAFPFTADGSQSVPPVSTTAAGDCEVHLSEGQGLLWVSCTHDVASPSMAHVHNAPAGANGGVAFPFASGTSPVEDIWAIDPTNLGELLADNLYVNVHSTDFSGGEIRGQVLIGIFADGFETGDITAWLGEPTATSVSISGTAHEGQTLTGNYTYGDPQGDPEGTSTFRWLRDDVAISGATASTYTLVAADVGAAIKFEVTPVAVNPPTTGDAAESAATSTVLGKPTATSLSILGTAEEFQTLMADYTYGDPEGDPEGESTFRWFRDSTAIPGATDRNYLLVTADVGSTIKVEVTPVSLNAPTTGNPVESGSTDVVTSR